MKLIRCLLVVPLLALSACSSTTMTVDSFDGTTGKSSRTTYSKYYDAGVWLKPNHLGMSVVVDHEKTRIPIVHGVQQSMGALGPSDSYATGLITIYIWNFDQKPVPVKIFNVTAGITTMAGGREHCSFGGKAITAPALGRGGEEVGRVKIFDYGKSISAKVEYELDGKRQTLELELKRRTEEELVKFWGPGGSPPYPWNKPGSPQLAR